MYSDEDYDAMEITPDEVAGLLASGGSDMVLVDVRETVELIHGGMISGAVAIPMSQFDVRVGELDRTREVVCYCAHGVRSLSVAAYLNSLGFRARSMSGGVCAWTGELVAYNPAEGR